MHNIDEGISGQQWHYASDEQCKWEAYANRWRWRWRRTWGSVRVATPSVSHRHSGTALTAVLLAIAACLLPRFLLVVGHWVPMSLSFSWSKFCSVHGPVKTEVL
jgi:hypothetical protein